MQHNGWLYFSDGAETFVHSTGWSLAHGHIPPAAIGYGWPLLTAPVAGAAGINVLSRAAGARARADARAPPRRAALHVRARRAHRRPRVGYLAALGWIVLPHYADRLFIAGFHGTYYEQFLPQALGLRHDRVPVDGVRARRRLLRRDEHRQPRDGARGARGPLRRLCRRDRPGERAVPPRARRGLRGRAALAAARWRSVVAALPAVATLLLWKHRGLGHVPHVDADVDFHRLELIRLDLRTYFYSDRLIEIAVHRGRDRDRPAGRGRRAPSSRSGSSRTCSCRGSSELGERAHGERFSPAHAGFSGFRGRVRGAAAASSRVSPSGSRSADVPPPARSRLARRGGARRPRLLVPLVVVAALPVARSDVVFDADRHALAPVDGAVRAGRDRERPPRLARVAAGEELARGRLLQRLPQPADGSGGRRSAKRAADCVVRTKSRHDAARLHRRAAPGTLDVPRRRRANSGDEPTGTTCCSSRRRRTSASLAAPRPSRRRATRAARAAARAASSGPRASRSPSSSAGARRG